MNGFIFFLVMLIPNTDMPTIVLVQAHHTAAECLAIVERAPADIKGKFSCIEINLTPEAILERNKI